MRLSGLTLWHTPDVHAGSSEPVSPLHNTDFGTVLSRPTSGRETAGTTTDDKVVTESSAPTSAYSAAPQGGGGDTYYSPASLASFTGIGGILATIEEEKDLYARGVIRALEMGK